MTMLLHICCGPCATATVDHWRSRGAELLGFFYNPNIHPLLEFRRRVTGVRDLAEQTGLTVIEDLSYNPVRWFQEVGFLEAGRCRACIASRLERAAGEAAARGCGSFSTTLAISPWQDHEAIQAGGEEAAARHGVAFVYEDLRPLYHASRSLSRALGLYRQQYCGCILSEWERYREPRERG